MPALTGIICLRWYFTLSEMAASNIILDSYVQELFCRTAHERTINWFLHILTKKSALTELSEMNCLESFQGFRRATQDKSQTNLIGSPIKTDTVLFLTISIHSSVSHISSTNAGYKCLTLCSDVFSKL